MQSILYTFSTLYFKTMHFLIKKNLPGKPTPLRLIIPENKKGSHSTTYIQSQAVPYLSQTFRVLKTRV